MGPPIEDQIMFNEKMIKFDVSTGLFPTRLESIDEALIDYLINHEGLVKAAKRHCISKQALHLSARRYRNYVEAQEKRRRLLEKITEKSITRA